MQFQKKSSSPYKSLPKIISITICFMLCEAYASNWQKLGETKRFEIGIDIDSVVRHKDCTRLWKERVYKPGYYGLLPANNGMYNELATLECHDCSNNKVATLEFKAYLNGLLIDEFKFEQTPESFIKISEKTTEAKIYNAVCTQKSKR
jgi:hypothetical protein